MAKGRRSQWTWIYDPKSKLGTKPSDALKREVSEATEAISAEWRQQYIRPVPKDLQFNYLIAVYTRWRGNYFSFCGTYVCPGPNALSPSFKTCFARWNGLETSGSILPTCGTRASGGGRPIRLYRSRNA